MIPTDQTLQVGDYVHVRAQAKSIGPIPETVIVFLQSKTDEYSTVVRADHVTRIDPPADAPPCTHMTNAHPYVGQFVLCERHNGHAGHHRRGDLHWPDDHSTAHWEPR